MSGWGFYFPDDGETAADATHVPERVRNLAATVSPRIVAEMACAYDYDERDGWERKPEANFTIAVVSPTGTETRWTGWHEPSVEHNVRVRE